MKTFHLFLILTICIVISACEDSNDELSSYSITGTIVQKDIPVQNAQILLDSESTYSSDENGYFVITNVKAGSHNITISKDFSEEEFCMERMDVLVENDMHLDAIELPKPVKLYNPINIISNGMEIVWSRTEQSQFREYKLYRHLSAGLDETTGTLISVNTNSDDTTFTDSDLLENTEYYYRVFIMDDYGTIGGSNIVHTKTEVGNFVKNGDFENSNSISEWTVHTSNIFLLKSDEEAPSGSNYLQIELNDYNFSLGPMSDIYQTINFTNFTAGEEYTLSFWAKPIELSGNTTLNIELTVNRNYPSVVYRVIGSSSEKAWKKYKVTFYAPVATQPYHLDIFVRCNIPYDNQSYKIYLDNIIIQKVD